MIFNILISEFKDALQEQKYLLGEIQEELKTYKVVTN